MQREVREGVTLQLAEYGVPLLRRNQCPGDAWIRTACEQAVAHRAGLADLWACLAVAMALLASAPGCGERPAAQKTPIEPAVASPPTPREVALVVGDEKDLALLLEKHRGKVVLVDFWATWCVPCIAAFPHTVQLHRDLAGKGLAVIGVSLDDPDDKSQVTAFLTEKGAAFDNLISRHGNSSASVRAFQSPHGTVPHLRLYDRTGKLRASFPSGENDLTPEEVRRAVDALLAEPAGSV
jgi:thiol-disulfide isomerase/thioredoxin